MTDAQNRRSILQGLQQTRSRLQRLHEDRSPSPLKTNNTNVAQTTPPPPIAQRPTTAPQQDPSLIAKQQKLALQQAQSQSHGYYISQPSSHGNLLLPVLPRFDSNGDLTPQS